MQRPDDGLVQSPGGDRVLRFGAVRLHNGHIQSGRAHLHGCAICSSQLEGALETVAPVQKPKVAESDGGDKEGDTPLAHSDGPDPRW